MSELATANPKSLDDYMNCNPEEISDEGVAAIVEELRRMRVKWQAAEGEKASAPKKRAALQSVDLSTNLFD